MTEAQKLQTIADLRAMGYEGAELAKRAKRAIAMPAGDSSESTGVVAGNKRDTRNDPDTQPSESGPGPKKETAVNNPDDPNSMAPLPEPPGAKSIDDIQRNPDKHPIAAAVDREQTERPFKETRPFSFQNTGPDLAGQLRGQAAAVNPLSAPEAAISAVTTPLGNFLNSATGGLYRRGRDAALGAISPDALQRTRAMESEYNNSVPVIPQVSEAAGYVAPVGLPGIIGRSATAGVDMAAAKLAPKLPGLATALEASPVVANAGRGFAIGAPTAAATTLTEDSVDGVPMSEAIPRAGSAALAGGALGAGVGAMSGIPVGARERVASRIERDVGAGEGGTARKSTRQKIANRADAGGEEGQRAEITKLMDEDPKLAKALHSKAASKPDKAKNIVQDEIDRLDTENEATHSKIDEFLTKKTPVVEPKEAGAVPTEISPFDELTGSHSITPEQRASFQNEMRSAYGREIPGITDAPVGGRATATSEEATMVGARPKAAPAPPSVASDGGLNVAAPMDRLSSAESKLRESGDFETADAMKTMVDKLRSEWNGKFPSATAVRKVATNIGNSAFPDAPASTQAKANRERAARNVWAELSKTIEDAAAEANTAGANIDIAKLKANNRKLSLLIPARKALGERAESIRLKEKGPLAKVGNAIKHPIDTTVDAVTGAGDRVIKAADYAMSRAPVSVPNTPITPATVSEVIQYARAGHSRDEVLQFAEENGVPPETADKLIANYGATP
jgi:hypothetical protein